MFEWIVEMRCQPLAVRMMLNSAYWSVDMLVQTMNEAFLEQEMPSLRRSQQPSKRKFAAFLPPLYCSNLFKFKKIYHVTAASSRHAGTKGRQLALDESIQPGRSRNLRQPLPHEGRFRAMPPIGPQTGKYHPRAWQANATDRASRDIMTGSSRS